jgi:hypothetical protein
MSSDLAKNPFSVQSPEHIVADDVISLFVEDFADFHQVLRTGHTFLHGARGSGKSMIFRYLEPDCQSIAKKCALAELEFFSFYIPIKETELRLTELLRLEKERHGSLALNEHLMVVSFAIKMLSSLQRISSHVIGDAAVAKSFATFVADDLARLLRRGGWNGDFPKIPEDASFSQIRQLATNLMEDVHAEVSQFIQRLSLGRDFIYEGALLGFLDFMKPFTLALRSLPFMPKSPIFLLIDDADNLSEEQTRILNTWISSRGVAELSLKVSTQLRYKTYRTISGQQIEMPHDFAEVEISNVYTSDRDRYGKRVRDIVSRRLQKADIAATPEDFFPDDREQEQEIKALAEKIMAAYPEEGRGNRARDDAYRYARPNFIRGLGGTRKSSSTYSYAGFRQLVHVSSGVVRYFLEPAALMWGEQLAANNGGPITAIAAHIQDKIVRSEANRFLSSEFERISQDETRGPDHRDKASKLRNLIDSLGSLFQAILVSDEAERRVFSVAFSNGPDHEVREIFNLGAEYNYFHRSSIGKKEGGGRTDLYILSRRIAPVFNLDPSSFAGYKFITNETARMMILEPKRFVNQLRTRPLSEVTDPAQGNLFGEA